LILDTNALSAYLDSTPEAVEMVSGAREVAIPVMVAGEFGFGIGQSRHREAYEKSLKRMLERCTVLDIGIETARHYAAIRLELKGAGYAVDVIAMRTERFEGTKGWMGGGKISSNRLSRYRAPRFADMPAIESVLGHGAAGEAAAHGGAGVKACGGPSSFVACQRRRRKTIVCATRSRGRE
jgi:predicted nucleic acid-binding protein